MLGAMPCSQRGREHEGLERRARLPLALDGEVELALAVVVAADHRPHRAVRGSIATSAADGPSGSVSHFAMAARAGLLELEVDRRRDAQPAAEDLGRRRSRSISCCLT